DVSVEPARPFWMLEYVSDHNPRKDYDDSLNKYERELKVPYCLVFSPDTGELALHRHNKRKYGTVKPNGENRYPIPELELEAGILEGWVCFWHRSVLLPLPADLLRDLDVARQEAAAARRQMGEDKRRADALQRRLEAVERELAELRARGGRQ